MFSYIKKRWITAPNILRFVVNFVPLFTALGCYYLRDYSIADLPSLNALRLAFLMLVVMLFIVELRTAFMFAFDASFYKIGEYNYRGLYCILYAMEKLGE